MQWMNCRCDDSTSKPTWWFSHVSIFSELTAGQNRHITIGKDQTISCSITGLDAAADVKWIKPGPQDISTSDTTNYGVNDGKSSFSAGAGTQTTILTLKKVVMEKMTSAQTYKCSVTSGGLTKTADVVVTPIRECRFSPVPYQILAPKVYKWQRYYIFIG